MGTQVYLTRIASCGPVGSCDGREDDPTVIRIQVPESRQPWLYFMIDNGAAVNVIKIAALGQDVLVDTDRVIPLIRINDQSVDTYGTTFINLQGRHHGL